MITQDQKDLMDSLNQRTARLGELTTNMDRCEKVVAVLWDFAEHGGESDTDIDLGYTTEEDCLVTKVVTHELTQPVGTSSTYTLKAGSTALTGATAVGSVATGEVALASSATAIAVSKGSTLKLDIGTADATAGKVRFYVYMLPQRDM